VETNHALRHGSTRSIRQLVRCSTARGLCARDWPAKGIGGSPILYSPRARPSACHVRAAIAAPLDHEAMTRLFGGIIDEALRLERIAAAHGEPEGVIGRQRGTWHGTEFWSAALSDLNQLELTGGRHFLW